MKRLAVAISLVLAIALPAPAAVLPFTGELSFSVSYATAPASVPGLGSLTVNPIAGGVHLTHASIPAGVFASTRVVAPVTDPLVYPIAGFLLSVSNPSGVLASGGAGALGGAIPLQGVMKVCMFGACGTDTVSNVQIPLSVIGQDAVALGVGPVLMTVIGAPWTTGTAAVGTVTAQGSAMGPASLPSSTAQLGGSFNAVTPVYISTNLGGTNGLVMPAFARMGFQLGDAPACSDGVDNDDDGVADHPDDPGCAAPDDDSESSDALPCDDGLDNDGDGDTDLNDRQCDSLVDFSEFPVCSDGVDNDGDGFVDHPADPGCQSPTMRGETAGCQDGVDNDEDGTLDFDGGASLNGGVPVAPADSACGEGWYPDEGLGGGPNCGIGAELALVLAALRRWRRGASA
jgi:hypothetical protein